MATSKYKKKYCAAADEYFAKEPYQMLEKDIYRKDGTLAGKETVPMACDFPTLEGFADSLGVSKKTLLNWAKENEEFEQALERAKDRQRRIIFVNGMNGMYNARFAMFVATNCLGMKNNADVIVAAADKEVTISIEGEAAEYAD